MPHHHVRASAAVAAGTLALLGIGAAPASAAVAPLGVVSEVTAGISPDTEPYDIASGPDGNLWFTEPRANRIARMTPRGVVTEFTAGIPAATGPLYVAVGPDGNLWYSSAYKSQLSRLTPSGAITDFPAGDNAGRIGDVTSGPDGNLWYVKRRAVGRMTPSGEVTEFTAGISSDALLGGITAGPDGNLWVTDYTGRIDKVTTTGVVTELTSDVLFDTSPGGITSGPDGALWFTLYSGSRIGRVTTAGEITLVGPALASGPRSIVTGRDGALWFTEEDDSIGRLTPGGALREFRAGITDGSSPAGITAGPDGNVWFASPVKDRVARIGTGVALTMSCEEKGGVSKARLKVVCRTNALGTSPTVRWKVSRKDSGALVARGRKALVDGRIVMNLTRADVRKGRHRVTLTRGSGIDKVVITRVLRLT